MKYNKAMRLTCGVVALLVMMGPARATLLSVVDYSDTFTTNKTTRVDGTIPNDWDIEKSHGNPIATWGPSQSWILRTDTSIQSAAPGLYPGSNGRGSATGFIQAEGPAGDWGITYTSDGTIGGSLLRSTYIVQVDAVLVGDRIDITSGPSSGGGIWVPGALSVLFRASDNNVGLGVEVFNIELGSTLVAPPLPFSTQTWLNLAVEFSPTMLKIYADESLIATVDLSNVAGSGKDYTGYSQQAVGFGFATSPFDDKGTWFDNFQVGLPVDSQDQDAKTPKR